MIIQKKKQKSKILFALNENIKLKFNITNIKNKDLINLLLNCLNFIKIKIHNLRIINLIEIKSECKNKL